MAPGVFETPMMAGASEEVQAALAATIPCPKRLGRPAEFGKLVGALLENPYLSAPHSYARDSLTPLSMSCGCSLAPRMTHNQAG